MIEVMKQPASLPATAGNRPLQSTTVRLPRGLYERAREVVEKGWTEAGSLNELLVESLDNRLKEVFRAKVDAEFEDMKNDAQYRRESDVLARQFATNDRDTLRSEGKKR